jgi:formylglycine-generating enzyme required for sulfatase activity
MKLVLIPAGKFTMGSTAREREKAAEPLGRKSTEDWLMAEAPQHEVEITRPFYLGMYEVTQKQYREVMGKNPSYYSKDGTGAEELKGLNTDDFPVDSVRWQDAIAFCKKLSALAKEKAARRGYRLPTEAEWEYACRAGGPSSAPYNIAGKPTMSLSTKDANCCGAIGFGGAPDEPDLWRTCKVGSYKPNAFGLYDMHGNVREWCSDWYDQKYYARSPRRDPPGPAKGTFRTSRGGSFCLWSGECRAASRLELPSNDPFFDQGFRVALQQNKVTLKRMAAPGKSSKQRQRR